MNRRLLIMSAAALALAALAFHQYKDYLPALGGDGGAGQPPPAAAAGGGKPVALNPLEGLAAKPFASILERPLFNPGRQPRPPDAPPAQERPPEPPPPPPEAPPEPPPASGPNASDYRLLGIAAGPGGRLAAVELAATSEVVYIREGDAIGEWTALEIGDRSLEIGSPDHAITLNLFEDTGEPAQEQDQPPAEDQPEDAAPPPEAPVPMMPGAAPPEAAPGQEDPAAN